MPVDYDRRILELNNDVADLDDLIEPLVTDLGARLIERPCIGIETAGQLLVTAGDNPGRIRSEAAWAMVFTHYLTAPHAPFVVAQHREESVQERYGFSGTTSTF